MSGKKTFWLKIDTGAAGNTLPFRTFHQMYSKDSLNCDILKPTPEVKLVSYSGDRIRCHGKITIPCKYRDSAWEPIMFYIVHVPGPAIPGLRNNQSLGIVTLNVDEVTPKTLVKHEGCPRLDDLSDAKRAFPDQFDRMGDFECEEDLEVKEDARGSIDALHKTPIHIKDTLKASLDQMEADGVIRKVTEYTEWCSSLAYSKKKDGSLRICIDPQKLNDSLKRCPHKIPTVEELNPLFANAKVFSKLDAKAGYWSVRLSEKSQLLTTFCTPFGQYCWKRLPFGLNVAQDFFQVRMDQILEGLPSVTGITDDVCVFGATEEGHNENLID